MRKELNKYYKFVRKCRQCNKLYGSDQLKNADDGCCPFCGQHSLCRLRLLKIARRNGDED